jgi:hypothetical protein
MMAMDLTAYHGVNAFFELLSGELQQFNRTAGGAIVQKALVAADGVVYAGPCIFYGVQVKTVGTAIDVHDDASGTTGDKIIDAAATTAAGTVITPAGQGVGVLMDNGIYVNLTLGTYWVFYVPQV